MLRDTHGLPVPADNPHGGPAGRPNRSGPTPSRPVSAVVEGQDERFTREPAYRTCSTPCWPCWYAHVRLEVRAGYEGKAWARKFVCYQYYRYYHYRYNTRPPLYRVTRSTTMVAFAGADFAEVLHLISQSLEARLSAPLRLEGEDRIVERRAQPALM